ncbi:hypothetical protein ACLOJK_027089 [Asimina triloba]
MKVFWSWALLAVDELLSPARWALELDGGRRAELLDSSAGRQGRADGAVRMGFYPNWIDAGYCRFVTENGEMGLDGGRRTLDRAGGRWPGVADGSHTSLDRDGAGRMRCRWWMKETRWISCGRQIWTARWV